MRLIQGQLMYVDVPSTIITNGDMTKDGWVTLGTIYHSRFVLFLREYDVNVSEGRPGWIYVLSHLGTGWVPESYVSVMYNLPKLLSNFKKR